MTERERQEEQPVLRVSEAIPKDVGKGMARMDPEDMQRLGLNVGDVIKIRGKKGTVAKVVPIYREQRGHRLIQIDGITRDNAQVSLGEKVQITKIANLAAQNITISPLNTARSSPERDSAYLVRLLAGLPVVVGDKIRVNFLGSRFQEFLIKDLRPEKAVIISDQTLIKIDKTAITGKSRIKVAYEDIGGLQKEIRRVREMIELPLRYPELFDRLGIDPPKGVLLYGPPGTGKTLIARAVAHETAAYFIHVNGPEIIHKYYGESEAKLRDIFNRTATHAPSIIFLDELDAIAPKRQEVTGELEKRVVAQLLALMDGLESRGQIVVIAATNIPNALDSALRRPGRFDREIAINVPDQSGRLEILQICTRGMPLTPEVELAKLAAITHGFVGADLDALCQEAGMMALREAVLKDNFWVEDIPYDKISTLQVGMAHFHEALKEVEPSCTREFLTELPNVKWDDIGGLYEIKQQLREIIEWPLKHPDLFTRINIQPPKGILLYGPPGTGKTMLAKAVANESEANFIAVKGPALMSKWVGESEKAIREVFKKARQVAPCIIFFDEIDALVPTRGNDSGVAERVLSQLLTEMDGIEELKGVVVLAATNRLDMIDPALLRPGRLEIHLELPVPDLSAREEILRAHNRKKPVADDLDFAALARATAGYTGAELSALSRQAAMLAIKSQLQAARDPNVGSLAISDQYFQEALKKMPLKRRVI